METMKQDQMDSNEESNELRQELNKLKEKERSSGIDQNELARIKELEEAIKEEMGSKE